MKIVFRYLGKEIAMTMLGITTVAVFIFLCNQLVRYLDFIATGKYAANMLFHLLVFQIPILVGLLLPLGLFLGILLGYGRLYAESEMVVLFASGMSHRQLLRMTFRVALLIAALVGLLSLFLNPIVAKHRDHLMDIAEANAALQTIVPGRFQSSSKGQQVFYVQGASSDRNELDDIFIAQQLQSDKNASRNEMQVGRWSILSAKTGTQSVDTDTNDHFITLKDGYRYQGVPGEKAFQIIRYGTYGIRLSPPIFASRNEGVEMLSTYALFKQAWDNKSDMAELQWRISMPLSVLILTLLALPLSQVNPRQGRFATLLPAILIYMVYANMIFVSRDWLESGAIPAWLGVFWVHGLVLFLAGFLYWRYRKGPNQSRRFLYWFV